MIKRYFIVVLLLSLFPAGVSAQRRTAAKKDWKAKYDYVGAAHDGRILVHRGGEGSNPRMGRFYTDGCFGYTDTCGTVVIPLIYDYADSFSNGFAVVGKGEKNDRRFGLIDRQGREVVPCIYADVAGFSSGLARVQEGTDSVRRYGYVDTLGQVVIPLKYDYARDFSEGMAVVAKGEWSGKSGYGKRDFEFTGKYGFIDRRGNEVIAPIYDGAADFSEVLAAVGQMGKYYVRWGFVDAAGTLVIPCKYYEVSSFRNGRAVVCIVSGGALKYGSIDRNGREILPCIYDWVQPTPFGTTWVGEGEDFASWACTLLDVSGKPLIDYKVYQVNPSGKFGHASAAVPDSTGLLRFGVLDGRGRVIVPFEYDDITIFSEWDSAAAAYVKRGVAEVKGQKYPFALRQGK